MKIASLMLLGVLIAGCAGDRAVQFYTKPEVDAMNATAQCKAMARNLVQIARCDGR